LDVHMLHKRPHDERRKSRRFRLKKGTFAALKDPDARAGPVGEMVNLGRDGAAFFYFSSAGFGMRRDCQTRLTVVTADRDFHLSDIPVTVVFDSVMPNEFPVSRSRHCGVKFEKLTRAQKLKLRRLFRDYVAEC